MYDLTTNLHKPLIEFNHDKDVALEQPRNDYNPKEKPHQRLKQKNN